MRINTLFKGIGVALFFSILHVSVFAAPPPCKGPNKNDPGCPGAEPSPSTIIVDSATVDWLNHKITVRGSALNTGATFLLGGTLLDPPPTISPVDELEIPFNDDVASEVTNQGNYLLNIDGADVLSIFVKSQVVDTAAMGCPCKTTWKIELSGVWGTAHADCLEILGPNDNDTADISGIVLSNPVAEPTDPDYYPQFPIGASFIPGDPINSVCRLVRVDIDASTTDLLSLRINEIQQAECASLLKDKVCATTTQLP